MQIYGQHRSESDTDLNVTETQLQIDFIRFFFGNSEDIDWSQKSIDITKLRIFKPRIPESTEFNKFR